MTDQQKQIERVKSAKATAQILFSVQDEIPGFVDKYLKEAVKPGEFTILKKFMKYLKNDMSLWGLEKQLNNKDFNDFREIGTLSVQTGSSKKRVADWDGGSTVAPNGYFTAFYLGQFDGLPQDTVMHGSVDHPPFSMDRYLQTVYVDVNEEVPVGKMFDGDEWVDDELYDSLKCDEQMPQMFFEPPLKVKLEQGKPPLFPVVKLAKMEPPLFHGVVVKCEPE
jgi:hypothetical protein